MNNKWALEELGNICDILDHRRKPITKKDRIEGDIPYYGATGILSYVKDYIFDEQLVLLGEDGAKWGSGENSAFIISGKTWVNNHAHVLRPNRELLEDKWLVYYLNFQDLMPFITGMTVPKLNQGNMRKIPIPLPPLDTQKEILTVLDQVFEAIKHVESNLVKNIHNVKELFKSKLNDILTYKGEGWEEIKLGDVLSLEYGKPLPQEERDEDGLYPVYGANGIKSRSNKFYIDYPSLIVGRKGSAGEINYTEDKFWPLDVTYFTKFDKDKLELDFLYYLLLMHNLPSLAKGVKPGINRNDVYALNVTIPSPRIQKEVSLILNELNNQTTKLIKTYQKKLNNLSDLKKSILQKAFLGELVI